MKKFIAIILAVAMTAAIAMTCVTANGGRYVWSHGGGANLGDPFGDTTMVGYQSPLDASVRFKTDVSFSKILFPMIWAYPHAEVTVEIISDGTVAASSSFELYNAENGSGDVAGVEVDFVKTLAAGEYTLRISTLDGQYAFFAYGDDPLSDEYIEYERGHMIFGLYTTDEGSGFVRLSGGYEPAEAKVINVDLSYEDTCGVYVELVDGKLVCTTTDSSDPWVSIPVDIDTNVYKYFKVTYRATSEIGTNNTYLKNWGYIGSPDGGDWEPHGMAGTADGEKHSKIYDIPVGFPTFDNGYVTGIRLTCCGAVGGVFTIESIKFSTTPDFYEEPAAYFVMANGRRVEITDGELNLPSGTDKITVYGTLADDNANGLYFRVNNGGRQYESAEKRPYGSFVTNRDGDTVSFKVNVNVKEGSQRLDIYAGYGDSCEDYDGLYFNDGIEQILSAVVTVGEATEIEDVTVTVPENFKYNVEINMGEEFTQVVVLDDVYPGNFDTYFTYIRLNGKLVEGARGGHKVYIMYIPTPIESSVLTFDYNPRKYARLVYGKYDMEDETLGFVNEQVRALPYIAVDGDEIICWNTEKDGSGMSFPKYLHYYCDEGEVFPPDEEYGYENPLITLYAMWSGDGTYEGIKYQTGDDVTVYGDDSFRSGTTVALTSYNNYYLINECIELIDGAGDMAVYEITAQYAGQTVQPDGPVKVVLNVPDYMSLDNLKLAYVDEYAGTYEEIPIEIDYENRTVTAYLTHFSIYALYNEVETPELPYLPGDINGDGAVNNKDVVYLFRYVSGDLEDSEVVELALDFNGDGKVNNRDVTRLFWYVSGKI